MKHLHSCSGVRKGRRAEARRHEPGESLTPLQSLTNETCMCVHTSNSLRGQGSRPKKNVHVNEYCFSRHQTQHTNRLIAEKTPASARRNFNSALSLCAFSCATPTYGAKPSHTTKMSALCGWESCVRGICACACSYEAPPKRHGQTGKDTRHSLSDAPKRRRFH